MAIAEGEEIVIGRALSDVKQGEYSEFAFVGDYAIEYPDSDYMIVVSRPLMLIGLPVIVLFLLAVGFLLGVWWSWSG